jgi:phosphatidylglycerol lysyltransferase
MDVASRVMYRKSGTEPIPVTERTRHMAGAVVGLLLFALALALLAHQLRGYRWSQVVAALRTLPPPRIAAAVALAALNYLVLTGYDTLAARFVGKPLPYRRTAFASFVSYVIAHNVGASFIGGTAMRLHLYTGWGLSAGDVAGMAALNAATFWLGLLVLLGVSLVAAPATFSHALPAHLAIGRPVGVLCLALVAVYVIAAAFLPSEITWRRWRIRMPSVRIALAQIGLSCADWLLAVGVLYVLLPPHRPAYRDFVGVFLVAQVAGVASHVPAGLGVFEVVLLQLFPRAAAGSALLAALVAYRVVYYILPLLLAAALLGARELARRREHLARLAAGLGRWLPAPQVLSATCFLSGIVLLASGATPAAKGRLGLLEGVLPLGVVEASHFVASIAGAGLLLLARGLQLRLDAAWAVTVALLPVGVVASLLKGVDYEEAILLGVVLAALLPCRPQFYRRASLLHEPFTAEWVFAIVFVLLGISWLLIFSHKHLEYSRELLWQFELRAQAPRSLRATAGAMGLLAVFGAWRLLRPAIAEPPPPTADDLDRVATIVARSPHPSAYLALLGDKSFLFDRERTGFLMYAIAGRSWVALGDPIGPPEIVKPLIWHFRELSDRHNGWTVFYEVGPDHLPVYLDLGLHLRKLGEEALVDLRTFTLEGGARKALRQAHHRAQRDGLRFEVVPATGVDALLGDLEAVSDAWLSQKQTREKGFSLGFFDPDYLRRMPVAVVRDDHGSPVAFANLMPGAEHEELSCDLMRYRPGIRTGIMDFLFVELLLWGKADGYRWFNLGMAPLSGFEDRVLAPLWSRLGALLFRHGEDFYNFQGLRQFKEKFDPAWQPRYLVSPGGVVLPRVLANVASLVSGGLGGIVTR